MKYLGGIFFLFLVWIMIFLVLAAGEDYAGDGEIPVYSYIADENFYEPDPVFTESSDGEVSGGLIYSYSPEYDEDGDIIITFADSLGGVETQKLEEYLVGTVFAEMPSKFEPEALKAQAVAARSYCYYKMANRSVSDAGGHPDADVCGDFAHCQAYISYESACQLYGDSYTGEAFGKIRDAVFSTKGEILIYQNEPAIAVFHAMSASFTESAVNVWGGDVPYLVSSPTPEDLSTEKIYSEEILSSSFVLEALTGNGYSCSADSPVPSVNLNDSGRVEYVNILGAEVSGVDFRRIFSLRSADFSVLFDSDSDQYVISVYGSGHGVGMSQHGANLLALDGFSYRDILLRYYAGVEIFTLVQR